MTRIAMLNLAIKCVTYVQLEKYGWSAKIHEEAMEKWEEYEQTIRFLIEKKQKKDS